jgi:hypothetical protein
MRQQLGAAPSRNADAVRKVDLPTGSGTAPSNVVQFPKPLVGQWVAQHALNVDSHGPGNGELWLGPLWLPEGTYEATGYSVTQAGSTGALAKVVLYRDNGGAIGTLALDTAAVDVTTTGFKQITGISLVVPSTGQLYWAGTVTQGGPSTIPRFHRVSGTPFPVVWSGSPDMSYSPSNTYTVSGVTGTAPATPTTNRADGHTRLGFRRSA